MGVLVVEIENSVEEAFREVINRRLGKGEKSLDAALNELLRGWVKRYG